MSDKSANGGAPASGQPAPMEQALAHLRAGRFDESREICETILASDPDNIDALYALGWVAFGRKDLKTALGCFQQVVKLNPRHARAHNNIGTVLMNFGDAAGAGRHLEAAVAADPNFTEAYNNLGAVRLAQNEPNAARTAFEKAAALAPNDPGTLNNLAAVKLRLGNVDEAIADFQKLVSLKPDFADAHNNLANALRRKGRIVEALAAIERGLEVSPKAPELLANMGVMQYETGDYVAALADYDRALEAAPSHRRAAFLRAFPLLALGRMGEGWAAYLNRPNVIKIEGRLHRTPFAADLGGTVIVLRSEGGANDDLEFLRFVPELVRRGAEVRIGAASAAAAVALTLDGVTGIAPEGPGGAPGVLEVALGDLPYLLGIETTADLPPPAPFRPDESRTDAIAARLNASGRGPFTGVTWQRLARGGATAVPLDGLAQALKGGGGTLIMLQRGAPSDMLGRLETGSGLPVADLSDMVDDMTGLLSLFTLLNRYVCIPGIGLSLRQAVGKPADIMVPAPVDYRFAGTGESSPWFPGCRLHRAALGPDWGPALGSLAAAPAADG
ncbi:MAG: tetratricopeptide repeat protein [Alphaproteobacteria bacterium]|nr:tetratricopeptide repeat protein [Alphaproteobacteria bacterium]